MKCAVNRLIKTVGEVPLTGEELGRRLAQEIADAELEHAAQQFATVVGMVRQGDSDQAQLTTARRRLQEAAQGWCDAQGHAEVPSTQQTAAASVGQPRPGPARWGCGAGLTEVYRLSGRACRSHAQRAPGNGGAAYRKAAPVARSGAAGASPSVGTDDAA